MKHTMENSGLKEYKDFREGQILSERWRGNKRRLILCKGIYKDENGIFYAGFQYIDQKATRQNKRTTVSGKSPFWFEKII